MRQKHQKTKSIYLSIYLSISALVGWEAGDTSGRDTDAPAGGNSNFSETTCLWSVGGNRSTRRKHVSCTQTVLSRATAPVTVSCFSLNWNIVLRLLLSPSSRHTPLSAATSNLYRLHSAFHATVILKAGGSEDFLMWYFSTMWCFFFLSLSELQLCILHCADIW